MEVLRASSWHSQETTQSLGGFVVSYVTALMKLSESCGFGALRESLVCDRLILEVKDDRVCETLLGKPGLNLDKAVETIKASQVNYSRATEISEEFSAN